jgi:hypothetical protein
VPGCREVQRDGDVESRAYPVRLQQADDLGFCRGLLLGGAWSRPEWDKLTTEELQIR